ncbi:MAG: hypothetical protein WC891_02775 [Actinomycetota bacterium]
MIKKVDSGQLRYIFELANKVDGCVHAGIELGTKGSLNPDLCILLDEIQKLEKIVNKG